MILILKQFVMQDQIVNALEILLQLLKTNVEGSVHLFQQLEIHVTKQNVVIIPMQL